ncbi:amine sulfotransferase-like [Clytia hemisphaerica]
MDSNKHRQLKSEPLKSQYLSPFERIGYIYNVEWCSELNILGRKEYFDNQEKVESCELFDDDVIVCGNGKTGSNWCERIVWALMYDIKLEIQNPPPVNLFMVTLGIHPFNTEEEFLSKLSRPRLLKTPLPYELLPKQFREKRTKAKIIYMYRNPRDVCQSAFNHFKTLHDDFSGTLQDVVNLMTNDVGNAFGPYFKHILGYWNRRLDENLLVISYEEMKKDFSGHIKKISDFLDIEISNEDLVAFTNRFSFETMKANAEKMLSFNASQKNYSSTVDAALKGKTMFNKGQIGSWKALFTPEMTKQMEEWETKWLKDTDLKLIYE